MQLLFFQQLSSVAPAAIVAASRACVTAAAAAGAGASRHLGSHAVTGCGGTAGGGGAGSSSFAPPARSTANRGATPPPPAAPQQQQQQQQRRQFQTAAAPAAPQWGGYLRTGTGAAAEQGPHEARYFVTGASGQIGQELLPFLRAQAGVNNVIASDVRTSRKLLEQGPFHYCDVLDRDSMARIILENGVTHVVHLATLLSAIGERNPALALKVNLTGAQNVLELAAAHGLGVFAPSTIAVFGPETPRHGTPDTTIKAPKTVYGICKVHQELLGDYYRERYGVDYRSLRLPGIISANAPPGGGTTDFSVEIFSAALSREAHYTCYLDADARLPMMYMPDLLRAFDMLMKAPRERLLQATYNIAAVSFTPAELAAAIRRRLPGFSIDYKPDFRDDIARSWPASIDDSAARDQFGWRHEYGLEAMVDDMLRRLAPRFPDAPLPPELRAP